MVATQGAGNRAHQPDLVSLATMRSMTTAHPRTLMSVHAHPDDETIGTGGTMARAVADGHRVVLVTCTRGELGEIVVPDMDTPDNHRRLGEIRAGELERAMGDLGVTEWENLGYRDSGMMGTAGNHDPRSFWQADLDEAIGRLTWLVRKVRPDVMTTYNAFGGYGHPDHIRPISWRSARSPGRATRAPTPISSPPSTAGPARPRRTAVWRHGPRPSSTNRRCRVRCGRR